MNLLYKITKLEEYAEVKLASVVTVSPSSCNQAFLDSHNSEVG